MSIIWTLFVIINGTPIITSANFNSLNDCRKAVEIIQQADTEKQLSVSCVATEVSVLG